MNSRYLLTFVPLFPVCIFSFLVDKLPSKSKLREVGSVNVVLKKLFVTICCYLCVLITFYSYLAYAKMRPSTSLLLAHTHPWMVCFRCLMLPDYFSVTDCGWIFSNGPKDESVCLIWSVLS